MMQLPRFLLPKTYSGYFQIWETLCILSTLDTTRCPYTSLLLSTNFNHLEYVEIYSQRFLLSCLAFLVSLALLSARFFNDFIEAYNMEFVIASAVFSILHLSQNGIVEVPTDFQPIFIISHVKLHRRNFSIPNSFCKTAGTPQTVLLFFSAARCPHR